MNCIQKWSHAGSPHHLVIPVGEGSNYEDSREEALNFFGVGEETLFLVVEGTMSDEDLFAMSEETEEFLGGGCYL